LPWLRVDLEALSQASYTLVHAEMAEASHNTRIKTGSVISHGYVHFLALFSHGHLDGARVSMADSIVHRLLNDTVDACLVVLQETVDCVVGGNHDVAPGPLASFSRMPVQGLRQTQDRPALTAEVEVQGREPDLWSSRQVF